VANYRERRGSASNRAPTPHKPYLTGCWLSRVRSHRTLANHGELRRRLLQRHEIVGTEDELPHHARFRLAICRSSVTLPVNLAYRCGALVAVIQWMLLIAAMCACRVAVAPADGGLLGERQSDRPPLFRRCSLESQLAVAVFEGLSSPGCRNLRVWLALEARA
jgi:hypothetical protein